MLTYDKDIKFYLCLRTFKYINTIISKALQQNIWIYVNRFPKSKICPHDSWCLDINPSLRALPQLYWAWEEKLSLKTSSTEFKGTSYANQRTAGTDLYLKPTGLGQEVTPYLLEQILLGNNIYYLKT